jgi:hypothetical protein
MSLEDLRRQAEAEEANAEEVEQPEEEEGEEAEGEEPEADAEESDTEQDTEEASDDFELELDGEPEPGQQKPSPEEALVYKLTKQKQKTREYKSELEELKAEIAALKSGSAPQAQPKPQQQEEKYPPVPLLYENGVDTPEQYQKAYQKWVADCKAVDQRNSQRSETENQFKRQTEEVTRKLAERVGKFAVEHKIRDDKVISAIERATSEIDGATKIDGSLAYLLDAVGDGSERVAYYIGTNDNAMAKVKGLLQEDPTGLRASAYMARLVGQLKPNQRTKTSKAPPPDQPIKGDGSSASAKALQDRYTKTKDPQEMLKLRRKARELGVRLT